MRYGISRVFNIVSYGRALQWGTISLLAPLWNMDGGLELTIKIGASAYGTSNIHMQDLSIICDATLL